MKGVTCDVVHLTLDLTEDHSVFLNATGVLSVLVEELRPDNESILATIAYPNRHPCGR